MKRVSIVVALASCKLVFPDRTPPRPVDKPPATRAEAEAKLRDELDKVGDDDCAKSKWLATQAGRDGFEGEVIEELRAQYACDRPKIAATTTAAEPIVELVFDGGPCTRADVQAKLRAKGARVVDDAAIEDAFARCFAVRVKECQLALDADVDEGVACWRKQPFAEVPRAISPADIGATTMCLGELKAVVADLRTCREKKPADRDACIAPYVGYVPKCPLLDPGRAWKAFPGSADVERLANADTARRAEREAKLAKEKAEREERIAKEVERCQGDSTLEFAKRLRDKPGPRTVPGCSYAVAGKIVSRNNVYAQLVDPTGTLVVLLRVAEPIVEGATLADRTARFQGLEKVELADGTAREFPVFVLTPK